MALVSTNAILSAQTANAQFVAKIGGPDTDQVNSRIIGTLLKPGFSNQYNLTMKGKTVPIQYSGTQTAHLLEYCQILLQRASISPSIPKQMEQH